MLAHGETARSDVEGDAPQPVDRSWQRIDSLVVAAMTVIALVTVGLFTQAYPRFSPIDEFQHVDYAIKAGRFEVVPEGEQAGQKAMDTFACAGVDSAFPVPPCGAEVDPYFLPEHGYNTAALQLPVYYTATGVVARAFEAWTPMGTLTSLRLTGALWLAGALALTWLIGAELGIRRLQRGLAIALFAPAVQILFTSSTVNADNALMVAGGLVTLAVLRAERGASSWWWVIAASVLAVSMEPTSALAVGLACVFVVVRALRVGSSGEARRALALRAVGIGASAVVAVLFFDLVRDALIGGRVPPDLPRYVELFTPSLDSSDVLGNVLSLVTPISKPYVPAFLDGGLTDVLNALAALALVGLVLATVVVHRTRNATGALGAGLLTVMVVAGPLLVLYLYIHSNVYFEIPARYGLALMPGAMAVAAAALVQRPMPGIAAVFAAVHALQIGWLLVGAV